MDSIYFPLPPFFDAIALREELTGYWREDADNASRLRARVLRRLKEIKAKALDDSRTVLEITHCGRTCAAGLSVFQDELIKLIYDFTTHHVYRAQNPSAAERMALVATGGYGRNLMAPGSDVDLLFILPYKQTAWGESIVESVLYFLWDLGYKVGHATRTVDQTVKAAAEDATIRTSLLDARQIYGEASLFNDMWTRFVGDVVQGQHRGFIAAKLQERERRLSRLGVSRYRVEPNIKEGKGGLRDLNMMHWLAVDLNPGQRYEPEAALFTGSELATYKSCEDFLWTVRCHLHFLAKKAEERLSFDVQPEMARRLRYRDRAGALAVERFMKHYFLVAKDVGDLTRIVCSTLEVRQLKTVPTLSDFVGAMPWSSRAKLAATTDFRVDNDRLNVKDANVFKKDPVNLIRVFVEAERDDLLLHPDVMRLIRGSLRLIDDKLRADPIANRLFLELLTSRDAPETSLRVMNDAGVLGRFIPDFGRVVAMTQFNMYHHYTVDEHLIRAIGVLSHIEKGDLGDELPLSTEVIANIQNRSALYVALLVHDAAKGRPEDHSVAGAVLARKLALRFGLSAGEAETAAWLVAHHLAMSQFAQSRDISDPKTIRDFADIVQSPERLKLLLLLTVADIRAVGPGIWTGWKGQLLRSLYFDTEPLLGGGHAGAPQQTRVRHAQANLRQALKDWPQGELDRFVDRLVRDYWLKTDLEHQICHAKLLRDFETDGLPLAFHVHSDQFCAFTELTLVTRDNPRLLMLFAGACAAAGANITSAQIATTRDGMVVDTLLLQRVFQDEEEIQRGEKIARVIGDVLSGKRALDTLQAANQWPKARIDTFHIPPHVVIDNTASESFTVVEVQALDRPGLLFELARVLSELHLDIGSAHVATFGERVVDVFYVTDKAKDKVTDGEAKAKIRAELLAMLEK